MGTFNNRAETFFNRCGLYDLTGDDAGWAPGQDPGFGALPTYVPPPIPVTEPYMEITCDQISSIKEPGPVRWEEALANDGLKAALQDWDGYKNNPGRLLGFTQTVTGFFEGTDGKQCELIPNDGCNDYEQVSDILVCFKPSPGTNFLILL